MKYVNTALVRGVEVVVTALPLAEVPYFDPLNPIQPNTYAVPDDVNIGWIKQGGVFVAQPPSGSTVTVVTALQGMLALDQSGMASLYETWANNPTRTFAQKAFINKAQTWKRDDPTLNAAANDLGLTAAQVDALFQLAATL